jgi:hypothetical protein
LYPFSRIKNQYFSLQRQFRSNRSGSGSVKSRIPASLLHHETVVFIKLLKIKFKLPDNTVDFIDFIATKLLPVFGH